MANPSFTVGERTVTLRGVGDETEARACARIMATSDPWLALGRGFDACLSAVQNAERETHVALCDGEVVGFVVVCLRGAFVGYLQTVAVQASWRGLGLGTRLIGHAEERILRESPNVFLCVSALNTRARQLYLRLGYEVVGELRDFLLRGESEWLLRKTVGPLTDYAPPRRG